MHNFVPSEKDLLGSIENLFERLKQEGKITPNDIKDHKLTLRVYVCEVEVCFYLSFIALNHYSLSLGFRIGK